MGKHRLLAGLISVSLLLLPTLSYFSFVGLLLFTAAIALQWPRQWAGFLWRQGFLWVALGLVLSTVLAHDRGVAYVQLANFLPFMAVMAALVVWLRQVPHPFRYVEAWAAWLLVITVPVNLFALAEYTIMAPRVMAGLGDAPGFHWFYTINHSFGHRAGLVFGSPNILACYLGFVFTLGLGLLLGQFLEGKGDFGEIDYRRPWIVTWLYHPGGRLGGATVINLVGLFCTGSRNGVLATAIVTLIALVSFPHCKWLKGTCWVGIGGLLVCVSTLGFGGRGLLQAVAQEDPRWQVWSLAWQHAVTHPWFGIGLGNYGVLYEPGSIMGYEEMPHAHNLWLMLMAEAGFPVAIALTGIVGWGLYRAVRTLRYHSPVQQAVLLGYLWAFGGLSLFSLLDLSIAYPRTTLLGWFALGIIYGVMPQSQPQGVGDKGMLPKST